MKWNEVKKVNKKTLCVVAYSIMYNVHECTPQEILNAVFSGSKQDLIIMYMYMHVA